MSAARFILWREQDRPHVGLVIGLVALLLVVLGVFFVFDTSARVNGESMLPALQPDDHVLITRGYDGPRVGDIVSANVITDTGPDSIIKRVIAVAGDEVLVSGDVAFVNGKRSQAAPNAIISASDPAGDSLLVPDGCVYLLGDNRPVSYDSRFIGAVPLTSITGRVVAVFSPITHFRIVD